MRFVVLTFVALSATAVPHRAASQQPAKPPKAAKDTSQAAKAAKDSAKLAKAAKDSGNLAKFFQSEEPLTVTLTTNIGRIRGDKSASPWRTATLSYASGKPDSLVKVPIRIKTRGIWRLKNCDFPPIYLNFTSEAAKPTVFRGLDQVKLTSYCRNNDEYEHYVLQELQLYRMLRLLTPISHAVRLVHMTYADSATGKIEATRYAFMEEEPLVLAARLGGKMSKLKGATAADLEPNQLALAAVFEYMIGNTDFAWGALHNVELLALNNGDYVPVIYDFDFSGAVNARYATVDPQLFNKIRRVRDRTYRGYCVPAEFYPKTFAIFNAKKDAMYAVYRDPIGKLLPQNIVDETLKYFDDFYKTINDPRAAKREIIDECQGGKR